MNKRLTIQQKLALKKYGQEKSRHLLFFGYCVVRSDEVENTINPPKPFGYLHSVKKL